MLKTSILKISAFALLVSFCAPMGLRAEATIENASQLTSFSASSAHSMSSDTHSDIEAVSVLSDAELKETQGAFWPYLAGAAVGGISGGVAYAVENRLTGSAWNWSNFGGYVVGGAVATSFPNTAVGIVIGAGVGSAVSIGASNVLRRF